MRATVLVCFSDPQCLEVVTELCTRGARVLVERDGDAAQRALAEGGIDLCVIDEGALGEGPEARLSALCSAVDSLVLIAADGGDAAGAVDDERVWCCPPGPGLGARVGARVSAVLEHRGGVPVTAGPEVSGLSGFETASPAMLRFLETARRVSAASASVLILGETGVGKERLAQAIHAESPRRAGPIEVVNCGAIPEALLESELFGHERGAFTGAVRSHRGYFERAHGGTLFLDEIGEMPPLLQVKLLRALQERQVVRVGGEAPISVDVRVLAATHRDLQDEMARGAFRADLFYRLSVVTLTIPPLRERPEDISHWARHHLEQFGIELRAAPLALAAEAEAALLAYPWPGNVRELINVIERAALLVEGDRVQLEDLPQAIAAYHLPPRLEPLAAGANDILPELDATWFERPLREARHAWNAAFERLYLSHALRAEGGRVGQAAARIGIDPRSLYAKMRALGLRKEEFR